jgi:hypothetical protein
MTDGGAGGHPGQEEASVPVRLRSAFVAHEVFGHGAGSVLVEPDVARDLRTAAELASQERRIAGGLLYGRLWADDEGQYLVVDGFLEAGPGENRSDKIRPDGSDSFALSDKDLSLLRQDAARMYSTAFEAGWWRSVPGAGQFGPRDFESQRALVPPGGAGLLVFGSGLEWGTAYLGPDGEVPGSVRSFIPVPRPVPGPLLQPPGLGPAPALVVAPEAPPAPATGSVPAEAVEAAVLEAQEDALQEGGAVLEPAADLEPEPVAAAAPGMSLAAPRPLLTPAPQPAGPRVISPVRVPTREWGGAKLVNAGDAGPRTPTDVKIVVGALITVAVAAAIMVGLLLSNIIVAVIVAVVLLLGLSGFLWMSRL